MSQELAQEQGGNTTDDCDARITGPQRETLWVVACALRDHPDPAVAEAARSLAVVVARLYDQLLPTGVSS
jgi:hypothetical protein